MTIASDTLLEIEIVVPSKLLAALPPGSNIIFTIDETSRSYPARVARTAGSVDPISQLSKIFASFEPPTGGASPGMGGILPGMSGIAVAVKERP